MFCSWPFSDSVILQWASGTSQPVVRLESSWPLLSWLLWIMEAWLGAYTGLRKWFSKLTMRKDGEHAFPPAGINLMSWGYMHCVNCCPVQSLSALHFKFPPAISKQPLGTVQWIEMREYHPDLITHRVIYSLKACLSNSLILIFWFSIQNNVLKGEIIQLYVKANSQNWSLCKMRRNSSWTPAFQWMVRAFGGIMNMSSSECNWVN